MLISKISRALEARLKDSLSISDTWFLYYITQRQSSLFSFLQQPEQIGELPDAVVYIRHNISEGGGHPRGPTASPPIGTGPAINKS